MHLESTIELLGSIRDDIKHDLKNHSFTRVYADYHEAILKIDSAIGALTGAKRHLKEIKDSEEK